MKGDTDMKYEYPTHEEINRAYEILAKAAHMQLEFHVYRDHEEEKLNEICSLIRSMGSFNAKDAHVVSTQFKNFFKALPRAIYGEGNPNNGNPLFDSVILRGDDYIVHETRGFERYVEQHDWEAVRELVNEFGHRWHADVHEVIREKYDEGYGLVAHTIKFWWD